MGKKLDRLLGRGWKASKLKPTFNLAVSRLLVLKNHRKVRCSQSCGDVVQLLHLGHQDRALLRVEQVIKEQNMLDAYDIMETYLNLLIERVGLIGREKECPEELKEAVSTLIFASSRCGDFPELQEIRAAFHSQYGKEFVTRSVELRNQCGVSTKMIQKMSTLTPSLEIKTKLLKRIAAENNIVLLHLDDPFGPSEGGVGRSNSRIPEAEYEYAAAESSSQGIEKMELSDSFKARQKYKDVADAAQAAFENAAYAAAAARAAVELSRPGCGPRRSDYPSSPLGPKKPEEEATGKASEEEEEIRNKLDRAGSLYSSESDSEELNNISSEVVLSSSSSSPSMNPGPDPDDDIPRLNLDRAPISLRARQVRGC